MLRGKYAKIFKTSLLSNRLEGFYGLKVCCGIKKEVFEGVVRSVIFIIIAIHCASDLYGYARCGGLATYSGYSILFVGLSCPRRAQGGVRVGLIVNPDTPIMLCLLPMLCLHAFIYLDP